MEGMTTTFPLYDSYHDIEVDSSVQFVAFAVDAQGKYGTVTLYFYDTENGDQCSLMTGQIEIVYFNPVGAMKK